MERLPSGHIRYQMKRPDADGRSYLVMTPLELMERVAALIPPPQVHLVRYFGVLAPNARDRALLVAQGGAADTEAAATQAAAMPAAAATAPAIPRPRPRSLAWAALLKRTFGLDVLACTRCGGRLRVVAVVTSAAVISKILTHLHLSTSPPPLSPARAPPVQLALPRATADSWVDPPAWVD